MTPAQHTPRASTAVAFPPHTPHASRTPDGQQAPSAVMAAEAAVALALQHVASGFSTPRQQPPSLSSGPEQEGGELQVMPDHELEQLHSPLAVMQLPCPEHICPRHASHCFMLHMVVTAGRAVVQWLPGAMPLSDVVHRTWRVCEPPPQVTEHAPNVPTDQPYITHGRLLHLRSV